MLSSGGDPDGSQEGRSAYSWHQLAHSICSHCISLCRNIHEQGNEDPHRQATATRAGEGAREGTRAARRARGPVTAPGASARGRAQRRAPRRAGRGLGGLGAPGIERNSWRPRGDFAKEPNEGRDAVLLLTEGAGGWGAGGSASSRGEGTSGTAAARGAGPPCEPDAGPEESGPSGPAEAPAVPGKRGARGWGCRAFVPGSGCGAARAPGSALPGAPSGAARAPAPRRALPATPRHRGRPASRSELHLLGLWGQGTLGRSLRAEEPLSASGRAGGRWGGPGAARPAVGTRDPRGRRPWLLPSCPRAAASPRQAWAGEGRPRSRLEDARRRGTRDLSSREAWAPRGRLARHPRPSPAVGGDRGGNSLPRHLPDTASSPGPDAPGDALDGARVVWALLPLVAVDGNRGWGGGGPDGVKVADVQRKRSRGVPACP